MYTMYITLAKKGYDDTVIDFPVPTLDEFEAIMKQFRNSDNETFINLNFKHNTIKMITINKANFDMITYTLREEIWKKYV